MSWYEADLAETVRGLTPAQRNVLRFIAARCDKTMSMFWGQDSIAHHLDMSRRSVVGAMKELEDRGLIRKQPRAGTDPDGEVRRRSNATFIVVAELIAQAIPEAVDKYRDDLERAAAKSAKTGPQVSKNRWAKSDSSAQSNRSVNTPDEQASSWGASSAHSGTTGFGWGDADDEGDVYEWGPIPEAS